MKFLYLVNFYTFLFCLQAKMNAQENKIIFSYDARGNMIERKLQVSPQVGGRIGNFNNKKDSSLVKTPLKVFPNPTNSNINIAGDLPENIKEAKLALSNISGQILKRDAYTGTIKTIDVTDLKSGMYLLEVKFSEKEKAIYKIIVTN